MSHTRFLFHIVLGTKDRFPLINESWENELYAYLTGIVKKHNGKVIAINGMSDHIHILVRLEPGDFPAFMRELKASSSKWKETSTKILVAKAIWSIHSERIGGRYGAKLYSPPERASPETNV